MTDFKSWSLKALKEAAASTSPSIVETSSNYFQIGADTMTSSQDDFMSTVRSLQSAWQGKAAQAAITSAQQSYAQMQLTQQSATTSQTRSSDYATSVQQNQQKVAAIQDVDTSFGSAVKKGWWGGALGVGAAAYENQQKYNAHRDQAAEIVSTMDSDGSGQAYEMRSATWPSSSGQNVNLGTLPPPPAQSSATADQQHYGNYFPKGGGSTGGYTTAMAGPSTSTFTGVSPGGGKKKNRGTESVGTGGSKGKGGSQIGVGGGGATNPSGSSSGGGATDPAGNLGGVGKPGAGAGAGSLPGEGVSGGAGNGGLGGAAAAGGVLGGAGLLGGLAGRGAVGGGGLRGGAGGLGEGEGGGRNGARGGAGAGEGEGGLRGSGSRGGSGLGEEGRLGGSRGGSGLGEEGRLGGSRGAAGLGEEGGLRGGTRGAPPEENLARGMRPGGFAGEPVAEAGRGGYPLSPGAGRRNGSDDEEAPVPDYLVETDDIWGDGSSAAPAVIGE